MDTYYLRRQIERVIDAEAITIAEKLHNAIEEGDSYSTETLREAVTESISNSLSYAILNGTYDQLQELVNSVSVSRTDEIRRLATEILGELP